MPLLALGIGVSATTSWLPTMPIATEGMLRMQAAERREQPFDVAAEQRMVGRVELRRPDAGRKPPQQFFVEAGRGWERRCDIGELRWSASALIARQSARRAARVDEASRSTSSAAGVPSRRSACAAAARSRRVASGDQKSP